MKKIILMVTIFVIGLYAVVIPDLEKYHAVERKVMITNIDAYPNTVLLGCREAMIAPALSYRIEENIPLRSHLRLVAINKELLEISGGIENADKELIDKTLSDKLIALSNSKKSPVMLTSLIVYVENKYPMKTDDYYYEITETTDNNLTLKLKKRVITFTDDIADKIIAY